MIEPGELMRGPDIDSRKRQGARQSQAFAGLATIDREEQRRIIAVGVRRRLSQRRIMGLLHGRSRRRYPIASAMCAAAIVSAEARSAMVRATFRIRWYARAES